MAKAVIIMGANGGIGEALAQRYKDHDNLILTARDKDTISDLPGTHYSVDVMEDGSIESFVEELDLEDGVEGFAYCVGSIDLKPFKSSKDSDFVNTFSLNTLGAVRALRALQQGLTRGEGAVVLFSTVAVKFGFNNHSIIASAKGALEGLAKSLAAEWAPKIRVNCIAPSLTETEIAKPMTSSEQMRGAIEKMHPIPRLGDPKEIAATAHFLLSDNAGWITGQVMHVDGGRSAVFTKG